MERLLRRSAAMAVFGVLCLGATFGIVFASGAHGPHEPLAPSGIAGSAPVKTTTTTLATCGAARDPFDPTLSPPPAGSPAICPTP